MLSQLIKIDNLMLSDHYYLDETDTCLFFGEYFTSDNPSWRTHRINSIIFNIKKPISQQNEPHYSYKAQDIKLVGESLKNWDWSSFLAVPIPPSKTKSDPAYDNRLTRILDEGGISYKEVVLLKENRGASHESGDRRESPEELQKKLWCDEDFIKNNQKPIFIFDDVITTGAQYKAVKNAILAINPNTEIYGCFIARRKPYDFTANLEGLFK